MTHTTKNLLKILPLILITGCATPPAPKPDWLEYSPSQNNYIIDKRPTSDAKLEPMSYSIFNCLYGTFKRADTETNPTKMEILNYEVGKILTPGKNIEVSRYYIYTSTKDGGRAAVQSMQNAGLVGGALPSLLGASGCKKEDMGEAGFDVAEIEGEIKSTPFTAILQIEFTSEGKAERVRIVRQYTGKHPASGDKDWPPFLFKLAQDGAKQAALKLSK